MRQLVLFLGTVFSLAAAGQQEGIHFTSGSLADARTMSAQKHQPLFLFAYSPGCHFCKSMESKVFSDSTVGAYYNTTFVNYRVNLEEGEGLALSDEYHIAGFPTYLFFDEGGKLLHISRSEKPGNEFIEDGKEAFDTVSSFGALKNKYEKGYCFADLLYAYCNAIIQSNSNNDLLTTVRDEYLKTQSADSLTTERNLRFLFKQQFEFDSPLSVYYFSNQSSLEKFFDKMVLEHRANNIIRNAANEAASQKDTAKLIAVNEFIRLNAGSRKNQLLQLSNLMQVMNKFWNDPSMGDRVSALALSYGNDYSAKDDYTIRLAATYLVMFGKTNQCFISAERLIRMVLSSYKNYDNAFLLARTLRKQGKDKEAMSVAQQAIVLAKATNDDSSDARDMIKEIITAQHSLPGNH